MTEANEKPKPRTVAEIYDAALKLSAEERESLYLMLLTDGDQSVDPEIERAAIAECERRDALVRDGKMELVNADEVIRKARRILDELPE
jgi:hypothetical protein